MTSGVLVQFLPLLLIAAVIDAQVRAHRWASDRTELVPAILVRSTLSQSSEPVSGGVGTPRVWCLLFGCIYFAVCGTWMHAVAALLLAGITAGRRG